MEFAVPVAPVFALEVAGHVEVFPVNRVFCVGRNYAAHAREMGKDPDRDPPFFFMKPANAVVQAASHRGHDSVPAEDIKLSPRKIELVIAIGKVARTSR